MTLDPESMDPKSVYQILIGAVVPRPIAFVATLNKAGAANLAPFSFFTVASANPPVVCFCPMVKGDGSTKDTLNNIRETGEFVVNVVPEELAERMNLCSGDYPPEVDEFDISGLTKVASELVKPARVLESPIQMECRLVQIVQVSTKPLGGSVVMGEVVRFHISDGLADGFKINPDKLNAVGRMGGPTYARTRDRFSLERPQ